MRLFTRDQLETVVRSIPQTVYAPVESGSLVLFDRYEEGQTLRLDVTSTDKSPKDVLFPQWEDLMHFRMEGKTIEITEQERSTEDYVLFGARACDIRAFQVLDKVFLANPVDTYYAARREHGTIVALACGKPESSCFCTVFGIDPAQPEADVVMWEVENGYCYEAYTEKGKALVANWPGEETDADVEAVKADIRAKIAEQPFANLSLKGIEDKT